MNNKIKDLVRLSLVATFYVVLTILNPFSYDALQFRISEILLFLCFFRKDYSIALTFGCFIANLFSPMMLYDILFGTLATALTCLCIMFSKHMIIIIVYPVLFNSILVGFELSLVYNSSFIVNAIYVAIGEIVVIIIGFIIFKKLQKSNFFLELIEANQNI